MSETEATSTSPDPRTAEVLRALQRARGMVANAELHPLRGVPSNGGPAAQDVEESLVSSAGFLRTLS